MSTFKDQTDKTVRRATQQYTVTSRRPVGTSTAATRSTSVPSEPSLSSFPPPFSGRLDDKSWPAWTYTNSDVLEQDGADDRLLGDYQIVARSNKASRELVIQTIHSPSLNRMQMYNEFLGTYLPKTQAGTQNGHFSLLQTLALNHPSGPALQLGMDALSLVQTGSLHKDEVLVRQAVRHYGNALSSVAGSMSSGNAVHDDEILAAVSVLATCELYEGIQGMSGGWTKHVQGLNELVAARGPDSMQSDLALLLYSNMRHGALLNALISRRAPSMAAPEWREVAFRVPLATLDSSTIFYDVAIQVPGLLERHDSLTLESPNTIADIDALLADSTKLEAELRQWFSDWQAQATADKHTEYKLRPISEFPTFASLCSDRTFHHAFMFPDFLIGYMYSMYWQVMHFLRTNVKSLHKIRHQLVDSWYPEPNEVVAEDELLGYALDLCQCLPFFVEPVSSSAGNIAIFLPLRTAALYFAERGHWKWLKWAGAVKGTVFVKGLSPPNVNQAAAQKARPLLTPNG